MFFLSKQEEKFSESSRSKARFALLSHVVAVLRTLKSKLGTIYLLNRKKKIIILVVSVVLEHWDLLQKSGTAFAVLTPSLQFEFFIENLD